MLSSEESNPPRYRFADVVVDCGNFTVQQSGQTKTMTPRAFDVLLYLLENPGRVVEKQEMFDHVWKEAFVTDSALTQVIKEIRQALGDDAHTPRYIETVHKRGYRFIYPVDGYEPRGWRRPRYVAAGALVGLTALVAMLLALNMGGLRDRLLGRPAPGEITSIAVLPLENLSGDPEQDYFSDGMTEALITE
ncbi:MAG: winged helix-turn-helix domain-containing protein, partial [Acidobacteria bacterium]|nr:winged helix-turn-helix domain-containing protein [Acidobacteriota bacterium]